MCFNCSYGTEISDNQIALLTVVDGRVAAQHSSVFNLIETRWATTMKHIAFEYARFGTIAVQLRDAQRRSETFIWKKTTRQYFAIVVSTKFPTHHPGIAFGEK